MARGKYAARAAKHKVEARDELIDRLTDQLAEAKRRARQHEAAAVRLPAAEDELARLRRDVEAGTSDRVRQLEAKLVRASEDREDLLDAVAVALDSILRGDAQVRSGELPPDRAGEMNMDAWRAILGPERWMRRVEGSVYLNRSRRRTVEHTRSIHGAIDESKERRANPAKFS